TSPAMTSAWFYLNSSCSVVHGAGLKLGFRGIGLSALYLIGQFRTRRNRHGTSDVEYDANGDRQDHREGKTGHTADRSDRSARSAHADRHRYASGRIYCAPTGRADRRRGGAAGRLRHLEDFRVLSRHHLALDSDLSDHDL